MSYSQHFLPGFCWGRLVGSVNDVQDEKHGLKLLEMHLQLNILVDLYILLDIKMDENTEKSLQTKSVGMVVINVRGGWQLAGCSRCVGTGSVAAGCTLLLESVHSGHSGQWPHTDQGTSQQVTRHTFKYRDTLTRRWHQQCPSRLGPADLRYRASEWVRHGKLLTQKMDVNIIFTSE